MIGGMATVFIAAAGVPLPLAAVLAILAAVAVGSPAARACDRAGPRRLRRDPHHHHHRRIDFSARRGAGAVRQAGAQDPLLLRRRTDPARRRGDPAPEPWVLGGAIAVFLALYLFLDRTLLGKAMLATAANRLAARLVGINTAVIMALAFGSSAAIGAVAGILITPITLTSYDTGILLALKGFAGAMLGGMGSPLGAIIGGLLLGLFEAFSAGYLSSTYKDAVAFLTILVVLFVMPSGLFGQRSVERV
jgi:branched-chain amino acid transport system permease protein